MEEKIFANALNQSYEIGPASLKRVKKHLGSFKKGWRASLSELQKITKTSKLTEFRNKINPEKEFEKLQKENIEVLLEEELPLLLKEIYNPPQVLYIKGSLPDEKQKHLTVVGPRRFSEYGKEVCKKIVKELKEYNIAIVSGLASGIDSIAHKTAIENKMKTVAVLGNGLHESVLFPSENLLLAREITEKEGCLVSEYPLNMKAARYTFPQRNRIAAGLSQGTLVIEAPKRSGSLITASLALESNREVFAVPNNIFLKNSEGANHLIKMGALPVTETSDILRALGIEPDCKKVQVKLSQEEEFVISILKNPIEQDEIIRKSKMQPAKINALLVQMQIKGIIKEIDNKFFITL